MAERLKGIAKGGWHPKGSSDGARESRLGSIKGGSTVVRDLPPRLCPVDWMRGCSPGTGWLDGQRQESQRSRPRTPVGAAVLFARSGLVRASTEACRLLRPRRRPAEQLSWKLARAACPEQRRFGARTSAGKEGGSGKSRRGSQQAAARPISRQYNWTED